MNKREFIRWQIKEWLPLLLGYGGITAIFYWLASYYGVDEFLSYSARTASSVTPMIVICVFTFLATAFIPLAIFSYQTNRVRADFYDQIPLRDKELRRIRILIVLISILIIFTIVFWVGILLTYLHQVVLNHEAYRRLLERGADPNEFVPYYFQYVYYIPLFFLLVLGIVAHYFTCVFFLSLGNRVWDCILLLVLGELLLNFALQAILFPAYVVCAETFTSSDSSFLRYINDFMRLSFGFGYYLAVFLSFFSENIAKTPSDSSVPSLYQNSTQAAVFYINVIAFLLIGLICAWLMLFAKKDPAGELAGKAGARNRGIAWIPHLFMLFAGFVMAGATQLVIYSDGVLIVVFCFVLASWAVIYFLLLFASRSTIRFAKQDWIRVAIVAGMVFLICLSTGIAYGIMRSYR